MAAAMVAGACRVSHGQQPTLWSFLGIGAAQNSSDPAIAAAAKAKAAKHKICCQKKALRYLASMGCTPEHPEVAEAILAAMGDPEEPVRYEAVKAVLQTAGDCMSPEQKRAMRQALGFHEYCSMQKQKCEKAIHACLERLCGKAAPKPHKKLSDMLPFRQSCEDPCKKEPDHCARRGICCTPEIREKLRQLAYGRDEAGCFLEPSERVRTAAEQALEACQACCGKRGSASGGQGGAGANAWREMPPAETHETDATRAIDGSRSPAPGWPGISVECERAHGGVSPMGPFGIPHIREIDDRPLNQNPMNQNPVPTPPEPTLEFPATSPVEPLPQPPPTPPPSQSAEAADPSSAPQTWFRTSSLFRWRR